MIPSMSSVDRRHWILSVKARVRPGVSGSPVVNERGDVVGIVLAGSIVLAGRPSTAVQRDVVKALPTLAETGSVKPAAVANAFLHAVDPAIASQADPGAADLESAVVRVFCFR